MEMFSHDGMMAEVTVAVAVVAVMVMVRAGVSWSGGHHNTTAGTAAVPEASTPEECTLCLGSDLALIELSTVVREVMSEQGMAYNRDTTTPATALDTARANCHTYMIALDYRGAFDKVSQKALLKSLMDAGVDHKTLHIIAELGCACQGLAHVECLAEAAENGGKFNKMWWR